MAGRFALAILAFTHAAWAQCSMCRASAAALGRQSAAIDAAIIVLFAPAVVLFGVIIFLVYRRTIAE
jgi:hypothetical protein